MDLGPGGSMLFPRDLQGNLLLRPTDLSGNLFPSLRDSTGYTGFQLPGAGTGLELFIAVDVELSGPTPYLYAGYNAGFQIWDLADPTLPNNAAMLSYQDGWEGDFQVFQGTPTEFPFVNWDLDALDAANHRAVVALASATPVGFSLWDVEDKTNPFQIYQDHGRFGESVALANINNNVYAFFPQTTSAGVQVYDVTRALEVAQTSGQCLDETNTPGPLCGGASNPVFLGSLTPFTSTRAFHVDVLHRQADDLHYLAISDANLFNSLGVEIRRINDPADPSNTDGDGLDNPVVASFLGPFVAGVDLFEDSGRTYLAAIQIDGPNTYADIYDLDACLSGTPGACGAPPRVYRRRIHDAFEHSYVSSLELNGTQMLYVGLHSLCSVPEVVGEAKNEYLINLTGLPNQVPQDGSELIVGDSYSETVGANMRNIDYWTAYYDGVSPGLSAFSPVRAVANGNYLYRAGWSIVDAHEWLGEAPTGQIFSDGFESGSTGAWQ